MEIKRLSEHVLAYSESMDYVALYGPDHKLVDCGDRSDVYERIIEQLPFDMRYDAAVYDSKRERADRVPPTLRDLDERTTARSQMLEALAAARARVSELEEKLK